MVQHEIPPVFDENSRVLVLGSFLMWYKKS